MPTADWLNSMVAFLRERARRMRDPVDWQHTAPAPEALNVPPDRHGNHTVRASQQITTLRAADASGREWIILEIVPVEPILGYNRLHFVHGHPRYELKDGTPVVQHSDTVFEVEGKRLTTITP